MADADGPPAVSDELLAVRVAGLDEVAHRGAGEQFAVVLGSDGPLAVVTARSRRSHWHMRVGPAGEESVFDRKLVAAVRGMRAGILAVAWVDIGADGRSAEVVAEDLGADGRAERTWTLDRDSHRWDRESVPGLLEQPG